MSPGSGDEPGRRLRDEVRFGVLGPVTVTDGTSALNIGGPKQRTVLAVLIVNAGDPVSIYTIIDAVWGEEAAPNAKRITQTYVATLRSVVGDVIVKTGSGWRLDVDRSQIDASEFEDLYESARPVLETNPQRASVALRDALALWRGNPYSDVEAHGALEGEVSRLSELRVASQAARIEADLALGRDADLIGEIEALMAEHPYSEGFRAQHMLALYRAGRQKESLRSYGQMRTLLTEELGVDPTPDLQDLEQKILDQDESLRVVARQTIKRRAILVADPGDPIEIGHLRAEQRDDLLNRTSEALRGAIERAGDGLSVTAGTTTYVIFEDALSAARAAEMVTRRLDGDGMRVAIDWGDLLLEDDRVSGPPVSRAAVMAAVAHKGQVLLSADAHQAIASSGNGRGLRFENLGSYDLHGVEGDLLIYQLLVGEMQAFPDLEVHRLPPPLPGGGDRSVPGYELREPIAPGSVGTLYRAFQPSVGREVLIEVIGRADSSKPGFIRRFEADTQRLSLFDHQNIAQVIDYWRQPDGAFIVYRFPRGGLLSAGRIDDPRRLIDQIGSGLVYAHSLGMVHGSVRPDRIALDEAGNASLLCFPVAATAPAHVEEFLDYLAPEVMAGGGPTPESDLYALGVLARRHGLADHPAVQLATDPDPDGRHGSVADFLVELNPIGVDSPSARYTEARNPYKGLAAFHEKDARDFHGRAAAVDELVDALRQSHLLTLVGPSGIGKSSVVRAGVIPQLRSGRIEGSQRWLVTDMLPGSHPFLELQRALERVAIDLPVELTERLADQDPLALEAIASALPDETELVVLVDQFEELFTLVSEDERRSFLALVGRAVQSRSARFVLTLRADFLDRPLRHSAFAKLLKQSTVMLSAPSPDELAAAIVQPARGVGVEVAPELVERIVTDIQDQAGSLPLLQHALTELFASRRSDLIGLAEFDEIGGVSGSVARRAETTFGGLTDAEQGRARQVFLRLVTIVDDSAPTRRRVRLAELEDLGAEATIDAFTRSRLLVLDNDPETRSPTVEVAHEALLTHWPRLAGWIDAAREDLALARRLDEARREWSESGQDPAYLLTGGRLAQHETWSSSTSLVLSQAQGEFLSASREHDERLKTRARRRRNWVTGGFAAAAAVAAVLAFSASKSADRAEAEELAANAVAHVGADPQLSLLLATAAYQRSPSVAATSALHSGIQASRERMVILPPEGSRGAGAIISPDGTRIALVGMESNIVELWELGASAPTWGPLRLTDDPFAQYPPSSHFWFSADGSRIYLPFSYQGSTGESGSGVGIYTLDAASGDVIDFFPIPCLQRAMPFGTQFVDESEMFIVDRVVLSGSLEDGTDVCGLEVSVDTLDLSSREFNQLMLVPGTLGPPTASLDGSIGSVEGWFDAEQEVVRTRVFDTATGDILLDKEGRASLSSDGREAVYLVDGVLYLYDVGADDLLQTYQSGNATRFWVSPTAEWIIAVTSAGEVRVFDKVSGSEVFELLGHTSQIRDVKVDLGETLMVSSGFDAARVWEVSRGTRGELESISSAASSYEGFYPNSLSSVGDYMMLRRGTVNMFGYPDPHGIEVIEISDNTSLWTRGDVFSAELGPNGTAVIQPLLPSDGMSPSGQPGSLRLGPPSIVEVETGDPVLELDGCEVFRNFEVFPAEPAPSCRSGVPAVDYSTFEFSADGSRLLGSSWLGATTVWDTATGLVVHETGPLMDFPNPRFGQGVRWAGGISTDGTRVVVPPGSADWDEFNQEGVEPSMRVLDTATGDEVGSFPIDHWANFARFDASGDRLIVAGTDLIVVDTHSWQVSVLERPQGARINAIALSPDGRLAATASVDEVVAVWDVQNRSLVAEIPVLGDIGSEIRGVAFLGNETIAVTPELGDDLLVFTLDPYRLLERALDSLNRPFTEGECATYDIDPCPSLEEMRQRIGG